MRTRLNKTLCMILMVTLPIVAHAQDEEYLVNKMPDISMTSPLSSQFNRFEFYPVSKATGVVDISIPLFSIPMPDGGSLPFSIALSRIGNQSGGSSGDSRLRVEFVAGTASYTKEFRENRRNV